MIEAEAVEIAHELRDIATLVEVERSMRTGEDPEGDALYREVARQFSEFVGVLNGSEEGG